MPIITGYFDSNVTLTATTLRKEVSFQYPTTFLGCSMQNTTRACEVFAYIEFAKGGSHWDRHILFHYQVLEKGDFAVYNGPLLPVGPPNNLVMYAEECQIGDVFRLTGSWTAT